MNLKALQNRVVDIRNNHLLKDINDLNNFRSDK